MKKPIGKPKKSDDFKSRGPFATKSQTKSATKGSSASGDVSKTPIKTKSGDVAASKTPTTPKKRSKENIIKPGMTPVKPRSSEMASSGTPVTPKTPTASGTPKVTATPPTANTTVSGTPAKNTASATPTNASLTPGRSRESGTMSDQPTRKYEDVDEMEDSDEDSREETIAKHIVDTKEPEVGGQRRKIFFKTNRLKTIENFMSYLGCVFPHFSKSILPVVILNFVMVFFSQSIKVINELYIFDKKEKYKYFIPFSKLQTVSHDTTLFDRLKVSKGLIGTTPSMDLAIMFVAFLTLVLIGTRHKSIVIICVFTLPLWFLALTHIKGFYYMGLFAVQVIDQLLATVLRVILIESVPKFHRTFAFIIFQILCVFATVSANYFILFIQPSTESFFRLATVLTVGLSYHAVLNIHDTLFNLLTNGEFNKLEKAFHRYITVAKLKLQAAVTVDHLAFENYETSDDILEILRTTIRTLPIMYELVWSSVVSAASLNVYAYIDKEITESTRFGMFDKLLLPTASYTVSIVVMTVFAYILPKSRLVPITLCSMLVLPVWAVMQSGLHHTHAKLPCVGKAHSTITGQYTASAIWVMGFTDSIRGFVQIHLLEMVPCMIRVPALAFFRLFEYAVDGAIRDFLPAAGIPSSFGMLSLFVLPISIWFLTPKKSFGLNVYFSEVATGKQRIKRLSQPPVVVD